jgi:hypothetical protein
VGREEHGREPQRDMLTSRVLDDDLRQFVEAFHEATSKVILSRTKPEADHAVDLMSDQFRKASARIGEILRALY